MPKVIPNVRTNILKSARHQLYQGGYHELSLRGVAKDCNIALGTTYRYFEDKRDLAHAVFKEDWNQEVVQKVHSDAHTASPKEAALMIYRYLHTFCQKYKKLILGNRFKETTLAIFTVHIESVIESFVTLLKEQMQAFAMEETEETLNILSRVMVDMAYQDVKEEDFQLLVDIYLSGKEA
jgi:AcrR family transcriptional regulator